jgi:hypothetical protein
MLPRFSPFLKGTLGIGAGEGGCGVGGGADGGADGGAGGGDDGLSGDIINLTLSNQ